jgi:hypothetical protein
MSYGIQSINSSGFTQIDENSEVFQVIQTGTKAAGIEYVTLPNTLPTDCLVFARPQGGRTSGQVYLTGYVSDYTVSGTRTLKAHMKYNLACDYAVVQRCSEFTEPTSGYGINVYKSNGDLAFTSEQPMLRVIAARAVSFSSSTGAFDSGWYQGATGSIDTAYVMLGLTYSTNMNNTHLTVKTILDILTEMRISIIIITGWAPLLLLLVMIYQGVLMFLLEQIQDKKQR